MNEFKTIQPIETTRSQSRGIRAPRLSTLVRPALATLALAGALNLGAAHADGSDGVDSNQYVDMTNTFQTPKGPMTLQIGIPTCKLVGAAEGTAWVVEKEYDEIVRMDPHADWMIMNGDFAPNDQAHVIEFRCGPLNAEGTQYGEAFKKIERTPVEPAPAPAPKTEDCVSHDTYIGVNSGNGAKTNGVTATGTVLVHGDVEINGVRRYDNRAETALEQIVNATPSNPAIISVSPDEDGLYRKGADISQWCTQADMDANTQQSIDNDKAHGRDPQRVYVWPGQSQADVNGVN